MVVLPFSHLPCRWSPQLVSVADGSRGAQQEAMGVERHRVDVHAGSVEYFPNRPEPSLQRLALLGSETGCPVRSDVVIKRRVGMEAGPHEQQRSCRTHLFGKRIAVASAGSAGGNVGLSHRTFLSDQCGSDHLGASFIGVLPDSRLGCCILEGVEQVKDAGQVLVFLAGGEV